MIDQSRLRRTREPCRARTNRPAVSRNDSSPKKFWGSLKKICFLWDILVFSRGERGTPHRGRRDDARERPPPRGTRGGRQPERDARRSLRRQGHPRRRHRRGLGHLRLRNNPVQGGRARPRSPQGAALEVRTDGGPRIDGDRQVQATRVHRRGGLQDGQAAGLRPRGPRKPRPLQRPAAGGSPRRARIGR